MEYSQYIESYDYLAFFIFTQVSLSHFFIDDLCFKQNQICTAE